MDNVIRIRVTGVRESWPGLKGLGRDAVRHLGLELDMGTGKVTLTMMVTGIETWTITATEMWKMMHALDKALPMTYGIQGLDQAMIAYGPRVGYRQNMAIDPADIVQWMAENGY